MRILPNLLYLRTFETVFRHLNLTKAADELCVTHSAVSQQLKALEADLGVSLIDRSNRKIQLTQAGKEYATVLTTLFQSLNTSTLRLRNYRNKPSLRLGVSHTFGVKCLIPKLNLFYETHPEIDLQLLIFHEPDRPTDLDVQILYGDLTKIKKEMILTGDQLLAVQAFEDPTPLHQAKPIVVSSPLRQQDWPRWLEHAQCKIDLEKAITFRETLQAIEAAKNGLGVFVTHKPFVAEELQNKTLKLAHSKVLDLKNQGFYLQAQEPIQKHPNFAALKDWLTAAMMVL